MKVPAEQLRSVSGDHDVNYVRGQHALAVVDSNAWRKQPNASSRDSRITERKNTMRIRVCIARLVHVLRQRCCWFAGQAEAASRRNGDRRQPAAVEVKIDNFSFGPATITVPAGTTVTWTNRDDIPHTVVSDDKIFKSKVLDTDEKFSFTFSKPGTYPYFCSVHPKMTGKVVVQ